MIDGISSKGTEIMVVLTSNHVEKINRAMLRPGRLDAVITITAPDQQAVKRLIRLYGRELVDPNDELELASAVLTGQIPAIIRECTERAKLYAIGRSDDDNSLQITDEDVHGAAVGMKPHMDLLEQKVESRRDPSFKEMLTEASLGAMANVLSVQHSIVQGVHQVDGRVRSVANDISQMSGGRSALIQAIQNMLEEIARKQRADQRR